MYQGADSDGTPIDLEYKPLPARVAESYAYPETPVPKPSEEEESEKSSPSQRGGRTRRTRRGKSKRVKRTRRRQKPRGRQ